MKHLKIKKECIGSKVKGGILNRWYIIEEGNEQLYWELGLINIFETNEPAIVKVKKDAKDRKKPAEHVDSDRIGTDNDISPVLPL